MVTNTSHTITSLIGGTTYVFNVTAMTSVGEGPPANLTVTTPIGGIYIPLKMLIRPQDSG